MSVALVYAADACHTRGAIRHVVGELQMKKSIIKETMTVMDYWVSMVENWANANKDYVKCSGNLKVQECLLKMSKHLYRTFNAMKQIVNMTTFPTEPGNAMKAVFSKFIPIYPNPVDPESVTLLWVEKYRGKNKTIPFEVVLPFLQATGCHDQRPNEAFKYEFIEKINDLVKSYDNLLVLATTNPKTQNILNIMTNGVEKRKPTSLSKRRYETKHDPVGFKRN